MRRRGEAVARTIPAVLTGLILALAAGGAEAQEDASADTLLSAAARREGPPAPVRSTESCRVSRIVDGDTLDCEGVGRVRLIGMDTPERDQEPFGARSAAVLARWAPVGSDVLLERDVEAADRYGRALAYVWLDGVMLNWALVRAGYAVVYTFPPNVQYVERFQAAQDAARSEALGLWAVDGFACPPAEHRRRRCD